MDTTSWEPWPDSFIHFPGANIPQPQAQPQPPPALVTWPQVMLSQLSWGPASIGVSTGALQLPTTA
jgi:hypothetical protein